MGVTHTGASPQTIARVDAATIPAEDGDETSRPEVRRAEPPRFAGFELVRNTPSNITTATDPLAVPAGALNATDPTRTDSRAQRTSLSEMAANRTHRLAGTVGPKGANDPSDVQWLAERLNTHVDSDGKPYLEPGGDVFQALRRFQADRTGHRDGHADPGGDTEFALGSSPAHTLRGSVGAGGTNNPADVARVQNALAMQGALAPADYTLGEINAADPNDPTVKAIREYQTNATDGRVDVNRGTHKQLRQAARAGLRGLPISGSVGGRRASRPADVQRVQERLVAHGELEAGGFQPGELDEATKGGIERFQSRFMRRPDGRVDRGKDTSRYLSMEPAALARELNPKDAVEQPRLTWGSGPANDDTDAARNEDLPPAPEPPSGEIYTAQDGDTPLGLVERNYRRTDGTPLNDAEKQVILPLIAERNADRLPHLADGRVQPGDAVELPSPEDVSEFAGFDVERQPKIPIPRPKPRNANPTLGTVRAVTGPMDITTVPPDSVRAAIDDAGTVEGIPLRWMYNIAKVESNFGASQRTGSYVGLYQMSTHEMGRFGKQAYRNESRTGSLRLWQKGPRTKALQENLRSLGYDIDDDGYFGHEVAWAVGHFQQAQSLTPDSVVGGDTSDAIAQAVARGDRGGPFVYPHRDIEQPRSTSRTNARANAFAFARMTADRIRRMSVRWGRPVEEFEIYMMHQQGESGWNHHVSNPSGVAWENFQRATGNTWSAAKAKRAIWGNMSQRMRSRFPGGVETVTSADFIREWRNAYDLKRRDLPM